MGKKSADLGAGAEELLRSYFLSVGYFAVRGAKLKFTSEVVTDVDIWLYARPSPLSRERAIVDAKYKRKAARALERILWASGLQSSLGYERAIVATTDQRPLAKAYGRKLGVLVLDGGFWGRLRRNPEEVERLSEEELVAAIVEGRSDKLVGNWRERLEEAKTRLLTHLGFDACNFYLEEMRELGHSSLVESRPGARRHFYILVAYFLVSLDFAYRQFAFEEVGRRSSILVEGFRHGSQGGERTQRIATMAERLVSATEPERAGFTQQLRLKIKESFASVPAEILAEYFSSQRVSTDIFANACAFERCAYGRALVSPDQLSHNLKAVLGVVLDFCGIQRSRFYEPGAAKRAADPERSRPSEDSAAIADADPGSPVKASDG